MRHLSWFMSVAILIMCFNLFFGGTINPYTAAKENELDILSVCCKSYNSSLKVPAICEFSHMLALCENLIRIAHSGEE